jgi:hypothetical protein
MSWALLRAMLLAGFSGSFVEVGVHHGKSFIATRQHARAGFLEPSVALDVFDDQSKNQDKSGRGNLATFKSNLAAYGRDPRGAVRIFQRSSLELTAGDVVHNFTGGRRPILFSVDACHNYDCTLNDMHLAFDSLHSRGLIMLDDYWNFGWPGVSFGLHRFLAEQRRAVALAYGKNKVFVVPWGAASFYWDAIKAMCGYVCVKATDPGYCVPEEKHGCVLHQRCAPWHPVTLGGLIAIGKDFEPAGPAGASLPNAKQHLLVSTRASAWSARPRGLAR